jgi:hypothetical protein
VGGITRRLHQIHTTLDPDVFENSRELQDVAGRRAWQVQAARGGGVEAGLVAAGEGGDGGECEHEDAGSHAPAYLGLGKGTAGLKR